MGNYVVLLRAVNVAGKNKVNMKNLQAALQEVGFQKCHYLYPKRQPRSKLHVTNGTRSSDKNNRGNESNVRFNY